MAWLMSESPGGPGAVRGVLPLTSSHPPVANASGPLGGSGLISRCSPPSPSVIPPHHTGRPARGNSSVCPCQLKVLSNEPPQDSQHAALRSGHSRG